MNARAPLGSIAIVGAGLAGAALAQRLADAGKHVTVFEKDQAVGGTLRPVSAGGKPVARRMPWLWHSAMAFDQVIDRYCEEGILTWWTPNFRGQPDARVAVERPTRSEHSQFDAQVVASVLKGVNVQRGRRIARVMRGGGAWHVIDIEYQYAGPFQTVITATPAAQAASILSSSSEIGSRLLRVDALPRWTLVTVFEEPLGLAFDCAHINDSPLELLVCESKKPGRKNAHETWMAHATTAWSVPQQLRTEIETLPLLSDALAQIIGVSSLPKTLHASTLRWDFAHAQTTLGEPYVFLREEGLGCVGSWCLGSDNPPAHAWDSGHALADHLLAL